MPPIRTLLWLGPSDEMTRLGVLDAPTLDVIWIDGPNDLGDLPPLALDAIVLGRIDDSADQALSSLATLAHRRPAGPVITLRRAPSPDDVRRRLEAAGAARVLDLAEDPSGLADALPCLLAAIEAVIAGSDEKRAKAVAKRRERAPLRAPALVGSSQALRTVEDGIHCAAGSMASVLVLGETGSGKEIVARRIHAASNRAARPFVAVNCGAFAETLLESELFGHKRGSFTGADRDRIGFFERAQGGTLFLDEIGETSAALQARLLRAVQEREILRVGGDRPRPVDVRVIAATHRDLGSEMEAGRFREDLYYRLAVLQVCVPPLRERPGDVPALARHFLVKHGKRENKAGCQLSPRALRLLERHRWPGNVRELENEIQRALALASPGELITARRLSAEIRREPMGSARTSPRPAGLDALPMQVLPEESLQGALERIEAVLIREALADHDGRKAKTARRLGITREGLYKKLKRLHLG